MTIFRNCWRAVVLVVFVCVWVGVLACRDQEPSVGAGLEARTENAVCQDKGPWKPYEDRIGIIVMAGNVENRQTSHYRWYWGDTFGMYAELLKFGFSKEKVFFLSYGPKANERRDVVYAKATTDNIRKVFKHVADIASGGDLVYLYWVDHGSLRSFSTYDGSITHAELGSLIRSIHCKVFIGAFNPCFSGAIINDVKAERAIILTSGSRWEFNSFGWASVWRKALRGGTPNHMSDTDGDGHISIGEAYEWVAPQAHKAGEHPLIDDNGDGHPGSFGSVSYNTRERTRDGYIASLFSLDGYRAEAISK